MSGCEARDTVGPIKIVGIVQAAPFSRDPARNARVALHDQDFELVSETVTDELGRFELDGRAGEFVHMVTGGDSAERLEVAFPGETGLLEEFVVPSGQLWTFPTSRADEWRNQFAGCPSADGEGAMVIGEVRLELGVTAADSPPAPFSFVRLERYEEDEEEASETIEACYLSEEGAYDSEAQRVGIQGRFAMFNVPPGAWDMVVARDTAGGTSVVRQLIFVPEGGAVVRLPVYVTL